MIQKNAGQVGRVVGMSHSQSAFLMCCSGFKFDLTCNEKGRCNCLGRGSQVQNGRLSHGVAIQ